MVLNEYAYQSDKKMVRDVRIFKVFPHHHPDFDTGILAFGRVQKIPEDHLLLLMV